MTHLRAKLARRGGVAAASLAAALATVMVVDVQPAAAAWANLTGVHTVCANSLTLHTSGGDYSMGRGTHLNIDHFADSGNHAWGVFMERGLYGWTYNGWFC
ncbi:hypothetical protein [Micromonospora sp. DT227]|uniref:hypothetical protein n=1 Tax=Micromonospora sp. DT227 TaxID=3393433 RepID=UPI003CE78B77